MAKGSNAAKTAANTANGISTASTANANSIYSTLDPQLVNQSINPQGYGPSTLAAIDTQNKQGAGGSMASAVGQGALLAARTRNGGAPAAAIDSSARAADQALSKSNLNSQVQNANVKLGQQASAQKGLENIYDANLGNATNALGETASNVNANTNASNQQWDWARYLLDPALAATSTAAAGQGH